jgi:predicted metal-dependent hydrolase
MMQPDQVIRTRRKTFALIVRGDGSLLVRAPLRASDKQIAGLVRKKEKWIRARQEIARQRYQKALPKEYVNGEGFLYLGISYKLAIVQDQPEGLTLRDQFYLSQSALPIAESVFRDWYKRQAFQMITERVEWYAGQNGCHYRRVRITDARTRWGSCGRGGALNFAWRLVMAPLRVIDYVVIHELAHLEERNHSQAFWNKVGLLMPDYRQQIHWLKVNGHALSL